MNTLLKRIIAALILFAGAFAAPEGGVKFILFFSSYLLAGYDVILRAGKSIVLNKTPDEHFLMSIATIGAFLIGHYPEGAAVMLFYQVGELFQGYAVNKSRKSIAELMDIRPDYANLKQGNAIIKTSPESVKKGDIIVIKAGERVPLDGIVIEGESFLDTSALTGESVPRRASAGDAVLSGCINSGGMITVEVTKGFYDSTVNKILDLVENAASKKSESERFITKFARVYTPIVVILAVLLATVPPLLSAEAHFTQWFYRALIFLVVSCPCALVISVPLSFFGGIGGASIQGILVKGAVYLETLAEVKTVVFDKTGTLTQGVFEVSQILPENGIPEDTLLQIAAYAESFSNHPIAASLKRAFGEEIDERKISDVKEISGKGVCANINGRAVCAGSAKLMQQQGIKYTPAQTDATVVYISVEGKFAGSIIISDIIKTDAKKTISLLKKEGIKETIMLTGDRYAVAQAAAQALGIDKFYAELMPEDKVLKTEEIMLAKKSKEKIAFVGDGINDAPVLARADIGIAMGALGSDAAIEAADIVIMTDEPSKIAAAIKISKKTLAIARQNIFFALLIKISVLVLGAFGLASMWEATFADVGVTVLAVLNAFRALKFQK